jgi:hypothetical protein
MKTPLILLWIKKTAGLLASQFGGFRFFLSRLSAANGYPIWISVIKVRIKVVGKG